MGTEIRDIVDVSFSIGAPIYSSEQSFSTVLAIAEATGPVASPDRVKSYSNLEEVSNDYSSSTEMYKFAALFFGQNSKDGRKPAVLKIGLKDTSASETWETAYSEIKAVDDSFYFVCPVARPGVVSDLDGLCAVLATEEKQLWITSDDSDIPTSASSDIAAELEALAYENVVVIYGTDTDGYLTAAELGATVPDFFGGVNPAYYPLSGIVADTLSTTEIGYLDSKNCNRYERIGGFNIIPGTSAGSSGNSGVITSSGQFADLVFAKHYLNEMISESVFNLLIQEKKVPFTKTGENQIRSVISHALQVYGVDKGILEADTIVITMPDLDSYDETKKSQRWLDGVTADGDLQGAINKITITGKLAV